MNLEVLKGAGIACALTLSISSTQLIAANASDEPLSAQDLTSSVMEGRGDWTYSLDGSRGLWLGYYDESRLLRLRDPKGGETLLVPEGRGQAPSGLAMTPRAEGAGILWRDKHPDKGLYLFEAPSDTVEPREIGGDSEPLARFIAKTDAKGTTHLLWYGEKALESSSERYNLYYRNQQSGQETLSDIALVMPGIYPVMALDSSGSLMVFSWQSSGGAPRIAARFRPAEPGSETQDGGFREEVSVAEVPGVTPIFESFRLGSRWMALWVGQYGFDRREFRLEGAYSDDDGATWKHFGFEDLMGFDIGSLQLAADDKGHVALAVTARDRTVDDRVKQDVYLIRSADSGSTWSKPTQLRAPALTSQDVTDEDRALLAYFHARNPSVAFGEEPGELLVVWEDWRMIRSGLYASYSKDFGETWALSNLPLPRSDGANLGLRYEPNAVYVADGAFHVIAERYSNDTLKSKQLVQLDLDPKALAQYAEQLKASGGADPIAGEEILRKRAEAYWQAMQDEAFEKAYIYLDPFFKAVTPLSQYLSTMGKIKYADAEVGEIAIRGPMAEVNTRIRASVPEFVVPTTGETISQPEREVNVKSRWLWIDGEWVSEFRVESQDIVYTRY